MLVGGLEEVVADDDPRCPEEWGPACNASGTETAVASATAPTISEAVARKLTNRRLRPVCAHFSTVRPLLRRARDPKMGSTWRCRFEIVTAADDARPNTGVMGRLSAP